MTTNSIRTKTFENGICFFLTFVFLMAPTDGVSNDSLVINTRFGVVRGLNADDGDYRMFMGIPYARVNMSNPFGASIPITSFNGTFDAIDDKTMCPQREEFNNTIVGTLECLNLNIYTPKNAEKLPVLVYIYGGKHNIGFASRHLYGPKFLVRHNIVLVFINFRVGPYGFLCLDTPEVPGNQGFKDQLAALRWVKDNIDVFGGDPNQVTICGHSSGAISVDYHFMSTKERLFRNVILQSGTALMPPAEIEANVSVPFKMAEHLGFKTEVLSEALKFLTDRPTASVVEAAVTLDIPVGLCVEKRFDGVENFMTTHPFNTKIDNAGNTNILLGFTIDEMDMTYRTKTDEHYRNMNIIHKQMVKDFEFGNDSIPEGIVKHFYTGDEAFSSETRKNFINFYSDFEILAPMQRSMSKYFEGGAKSVFIYLFQYSGSRNFVQILNNYTSTKANHADEIGYLFDGEYLRSIPLTVKDNLIIDRITTLWANFVKYNDPTPSTTELLPIKWPPATKDKQNYLVIDTEMSTGSRPFHDRMAFWDLFYKLYGNYMKTYKSACEDRSIQCASTNAGSLISKLTLNIMTVLILNVFCKKFLFE